MNAPEARRRQAPAAEPDGARTDRRIMVGVVAVLAAAIAVFTSVQSVMVLGVFSHVISGVEREPWRELAVRVSVNLVGVALLVAGVAAVRPERRRPLVRVLAVVGIALAAAIARAVLQVVNGVWDPAVPDGFATIAVEVAATTVILVLAQSIGLGFVALWRRARDGERARTAAQERAVQLLRQLQEEELRVRREIAETIHGSVQGIFVVLEAQLRRIAADAAPTDREQLDAVAAQLGALREGELRSLSHRLYPVDLARGTDAAIRTLLARLPAWVGVTDDASQTLAAAGPRLPLEARVVIVRVVEEGLSNALRHGEARSIRLEGRATEGGLTLDLCSDGVSPAADAVPSGLDRLARRAEVLGGALTLTPVDPADGGGARLHLWLPFPA